MKQCHFKKKKEIEIQKLNSFIEEFRAIKDIKSMCLCKMLKEWQNFTVKNSNKNGMWNMADRKNLPHGNPPAKPGIYAIFARKSKKDKIVCFHVGISSNSIRERVRIRLGKNIDENYKDIFGRLKNYEGIYICSATITKIKITKKQLKAKLELLEMCMTVLLKSESLLIAAENLDT